LFGFLFCYNKIIDITKSHRNIYDALAEEYEERADSLKEVNDLAVSFFVPYIKKGKRILDIGCGVGIAMKCLSDRGFSVTGIELSSKMARFARKRNPHSSIIEGDFLKYDFEDKFDGAILLAFIHLFPKRKAYEVLSKLRDILEDGGVVLIGTTESLKSREGWECKSDFSNKQRRFRKHWTETEFRKLLTESGFKTLELNKILDPFGKHWMDFIVQRI
jgi:SAM-dependent methyltransferase